MKGFFSPSSVVVIGVSNRPTNLGKEIARNLFEFGFTGVIHLVGPHEGTLFGRRILPSVDAVTEPVDLAVILTPAKTVPEIMEQCGRKGIKRVIIESGGFGEFDPEGNQLGLRLKEIAARCDMRFIGPNCIGVMNSANGLSTPFTPMRNVFRQGDVGIIAQSGGVALTYLNMLDGEQIGYSKFAAIGNKLDVDENDILEWFIDDPETAVICLYLESIQDGRRFCEIARRSAKPIVVHKANIGAVSGVIAQSHTQALANDDKVVDAALNQAGMVRFRDMQNFMDFVKTLQLPPMKGRNLAIVSRSGGHAVIAADAASMYGFDLPPFREDFLNEIRRHVRAQVIRLANPLDLGDLFDFDVYVRIIENTLQQENVDGILFLHTYFAAIEGESSRRLLQKAASVARQYGKPLALCVSTEQFELSRLHKEFDFPIFLSPERAVHALDRSIRHQERRAVIRTDESGAVLHPAPDDAAIRARIDSVRESSPQPLLHDSLDIVRSLGINVPGHTVFRSPVIVETALDGMSGPYAVKVIAQSVSHKSDVGGVVLGVTDIHALETVIHDLTERFGRSRESGLYGVLVQRMVPETPGSLELILGAKRDPHFGPVVLLGQGGIFVEILGRTVLRTAPLSHSEADRMIADLPGSEILKGVRGRPSIDMAALKDAILRVSHLMTAFPEIESLDVNPLLVSSAGATALDARIFLSS